MNLIGQPTPKVVVGWPKVVGAGWPKVVVGAGQK